MTWKLKGKSQFVNVEPHQGTEIKKILGHIISNPYSPTDYCISTDHHPYLPNLQRAVTELLQKGIEEGWKSYGRALRVLQDSVTEREFQESLRESLIKCLGSDNAACRSTITIRRIEGIITKVLHKYLQIIVRSLLDEIEVLRGDVARLFDLPVQAEQQAEAISEFKRIVLQGVHTKLMNLEGTISRKLLHHAMQTFPQNNPNMSDFDEVIPMPNCAIRAILEELPSSSLDRAAFEQYVRGRLGNVMEDFQTMLPEYINYAVTANRPTDSDRRFDQGIQRVNDRLQLALDATFRRQGWDNQSFVRSVQIEMNTILLHEMQQSTYAGRRPRLSDALEELRRETRKKIEAIVNQHFLEGRPERDRIRVKILMRIFTELELAKLTEETQRRICIATQVLKAENFLTTDQAEFLERENTQKKIVIIRKVGQYPEIFRSWKSENCEDESSADYRKKLNKLLYKSDAAYLVTSTYSYLEVDEGSSPFHESSGLNICGMAAAHDVPSISTGYPGGLLECGFEKFVAHDEVLFGMVIHKITLGPTKGAYSRTRRLISHAVSWRPHLDRAQIQHEAHSIRPVARAF
jgi:hypothetical protein